jgi:diguanylate cyclase (GGDEF)-like protein
MAEPNQNLIAYAYTDELTNLYNRRYLRVNILEYLSKLSKKNLPLSFIIIDLDKFKEINDTHGHLAGDNLLKGFAVVLKKLCSDKAVPVRYAGDEFVILVPGHDKKTGRLYAEKLLEFLKATS